jgi:integrase
LPVDKLTKGEVVSWLRELKATKLSGDSRKKLLGLFSRFCSWLSASDTITSNPVRDIPKIERPVAAAKQPDAPYLDDEEKVRAMIFALGPRFGLMFAVSNRAGFRLGEACGLRLSDTGWLEKEGVLRVRHSYDARLKGDKGTGAWKEKFPPLHDAAVAGALLSLATSRKEAGAKPEDRLFDFLPVKPNACRVACSRAWREAAPLAGVKALTWYTASRHTFASRALAAGASIEQVSAALGHSSPTITQRFYNRHQERGFATLPKLDLSAPLPDGKVLNFPTKKAAV